MATRKNDNISIPLVKEQIKVEKRTNVSKVRIYKKVREFQFSENLVLDQDWVEIEEIEMNREIEVYPEIFESEDLTIVPIVKEVAVVQKRLVLVKEIHIYKKKAISNQQIDYSLREEYVQIVRNGDNTDENEK